MKMDEMSQLPAIVPRVQSETVANQEVVQIPEVAFACQSRRSLLVFSSVFSSVNATTRSARGRMRNGKLLSCCHSAAQQQVANVGLWQHFFEGRFRP